MSNWQNDVKEFMRACGQKIYDKPDWPSDADVCLAQDLVREEAKEIDDAIEEADFAKTVDGCIDAIYVNLGLLNRLGVDAQPLWDEVHRANMSKVGGPVREDGKQLKNPDFVPPDIEGQLRLQGWEG